MSRRTLALAGLVALSLAGGTLVFAPKLLAHKAMPAPVRSTGAKNAVSPMRPSVPERLAQIDDRLRLKPDARALRALGEIRRLTTGAATGRVSVTSSGRSWKISYENETVGMLSPYPTFQSLLSLLDAWAETSRQHAPGLQLAKDTAIAPELAKLLDRCDDEADWQVLARVDARWAKGKASVGDLLAATQALGQLVALFPQDFLSSDGLAARALASLALARSYAPDKVLRAEAYLSFALGYRDHATALAEHFPASDPLRAFLRDDIARLKALAAGKQASTEARFFTGWQLALSRPAQEWYEWFDGLGQELAWTLPVTRTALEVSSVQLGGVPDLYAAILETRFGVQLTPTTDPLHNCPALEEKLEARTHERTGVFSDGAFYRMVYNNACHSAVYHKLLMLRNSFGSERDALALARQLPSDGDSELAATRKLFELICGLSRDPTRQGQLIQALGDPLPLDASQRFQIFNALTSTLQPDDPQLQAYADAFTAWLDSRSNDLSLAGQIASETYLDPGRMEEFKDAQVAIDGVYTRLWLAAFRYDIEAIWKMAESKERWELRLGALEKVSMDSPEEKARARRDWESVISDHPEVRDQLERAYAEFLSKQLKDSAASRTVWLRIYDRKKDDPGADGIMLDHILAEVARSYRLDGQPQKSWEMMAPRVKGMVGDVLAEAVRAAIALGKNDRAEEIARANLERYPSFLSSTTLLARVYWHTDRFEEAAQLIAKHPRTDSDDVRTKIIGRNFIREFKDRPQADAVGAYRALVDAQLDYQVLASTQAWFAHVANAQTGFELCKLMNFPDGIIQVTTDCYKSLKLAQGEEAAVAWARKSFSSRWLRVGAKILYYREVDELLWTLYDDPDAQGGAELWLMRTAALLRESPQNEAHRKALLDHYATHKDGFDDQLGAAMLGLSDPRAFLDSPSNEANMARAAYFLGAKAEAEHDVRGAVRLYQLALTARTKSPGRADAWAALRRVSATGLSLDVLAARKEPVEFETLGLEDI